MAKAVKNKDTGKDKPGKAQAKAPSGRNRAAQTRARSQSRPAAKGEKRGISRFMRDVRVEMSKVTWPTREELAESTKIVIIVCLIISIFTWGVDTVLAAALKAIL